MDVVAKEVVSRAVKRSKPTMYYNMYCIVCTYLADGVIIINIDKLKQR